MRDEDVGGLLRSVRQRANLRQVDVEARSGVSQQHISRLERGVLDGVTLGTLRAVGRALEVSIQLLPRWRGTDAARLLDRAHAELVEHVVAELQRRGWKAMVEYTFSEWGERGAVDVVGWREEYRALVVIEVKSEIVEMHDLHSGLDRKARIVPAVLARDRGWRPRRVGRIAVIADTSANRARLQALPATRSAALPSDTRATKRWLEVPDSPLAGVWFVSTTRVGSAMRVRPGMRRVRLQSRRLTPGTARSKGHVRSGQPVAEAPTSPMTPTLHSLRE
jgi:transcriptional regulator with XRE-family HTH domain